MTDHHHSSSSGPADHTAFYTKIFAILTVLTIITVGASRIDFGTGNIVVAMLIASVKAMLVALFFMHLKHEEPTTWLYAIFPLVLMAILIGLVFLDNPYRTNPDGSWEHVYRAPSAQTDAAHGEPAEHAAH